MTKMVVGKDQPDNERFGALLERLRTRKGLSRPEAAKEVGYTAEYLRQIEKGKRAASRYRMTDMMKAYGVTCYFEGRNDENMFINPPGEERPIVVEFRSKGRVREEPETVKLAGGGEVPAYLIEALEEFEKTWPGATFPRARPAIVYAILKAQKKWESNG